MGSELDSLVVNSAVSLPSLGRSLSGVCFFVSKVDLTRVVVRIKHLNTNKGPTAASGVYRKPFKM